MYVFILFLNIWFVYSQGILDLRACVKTPKQCPNVNITFWFYTRRTQNNPIQLDVTNLASIKNAQFIPDQPFKIIIHGYTGWKDYSPNTEIRPALFQNGDYNVISVDYSPIVKEPCYLQAVENVKVVSNCTAQLIDYLLTHTNIELRRFHIIGFSLGAHVAGTISEYLTAGKLMHISGLDPAFPLFWGDSPNGQLDKTDAKFVDVIHTNALTKGKLMPSGHVDFYCNGGYSQPGCSDPGVENFHSCNHARAAAYYAESINSNVPFWGYPCSLLFRPDLASKPEPMGFYTPNNASGVYCVTTNSGSPYAQQKLNST